MVKTKKRKKHDVYAKDSKDLLDNVEVTTVAQECVKLKQKKMRLLH